MEEVQGVVTKVSKGFSEKSQKNYHVIEFLAQNNEGQFGLLKVFLDEYEQEKEEWKTVNVGDVIVAELEEKSRGMNTFVDVKSAKTNTSLKAELTIS